MATKTKQVCQITLDGPDQQRLERSVLTVLQAHVGVENAITGADLTAWLFKTEFGYLAHWVDDKGKVHCPTLHRAIRTAINKLRRDDFKPICSKGGIGYWWPQSFQDGMTTVAEFGSRESDLRQTKNALLKGLEYEFGSQMSLL